MSPTMERILVIDDDANLRNMIGFSLRGVGYEVVLAADGREGVEKHREQPADLIVTDIYMSGQEGLETIQELRKEFPTVPIIAMSGAVLANTMLTIATKLGATKVLHKPFEFDELLTAIKEAL